MSPKKNPKKNDFFEIFGEGASHENEKYYGDIWLKYSDLNDTLSDKAKWIMYGGAMEKEYVFLKYSDYKHFAKLIGSLTLQYIIQEQALKYENNGDILPVSPPDTVPKKEDDDYDHYS